MNEHINKSKKSIKNVTHDKRDHIIAVRDNMIKYMETHRLSQEEFAELTGLSKHTLQSLLYKEMDDVKLGTLIPIAKAMNISIDELANTGNISKALELIKMSRGLPANSLYLIEMYIKWQRDQFERSKNYPGKLIEVMNLDYVDAHLRTTNHFEIVDISEFDRDIKSIVFRGMRIPCNEYFQYYQEDDILLLSTVRQPMAKERCVISYYGRLFIAQKARKDGVQGYRGIRDTDAFISEAEVDHFFGYVAGVKHP